MAFKFSETIEIQRPVTVCQFLVFTFREKTKKGITEIWSVDNKQSQPLGVVHYRVGWRTYVFESNIPIVFDSKCLKDLTSFIDALNKERDERIAGKVDAG